MVCRCVHKEKSSRSQQVSIFLGIEYKWTTGRMVLAASRKWGWLSPHIVEDMALTPLHFNRLGVVNIPKMKKTEWEILRWVMNLNMSMHTSSYQGPSLRKFFLNLIWSGLFERSVILRGSSSPWYKTLGNGFNSFNYMLSSRKVLFMELSMTQLIRNGIINNFHTNEKSIQIIPLFLNL